MDLVPLKYPEDLRLEPLDLLAQSIEILLKPNPCIEVGVIEDSNRSIEVHLPDEFQHLLVLASLSNRQNLLADPLAVDLHSVEVDRQEIRLDFRKDRFEPIELMMRVMEIVDNSDVGKSDRLDEPNLVLRFAIPTAVVVQSDLATDVLGRQSDFTDSPRLGLDEGLGLLGIHLDISPPR